MATVASVARATTPAVPSLVRASMLEQAVCREGLTLPAAQCVHGRADCSACVADAIIRLAVLVGL